MSSAQKKKSSQSLALVNEGGEGLRELTDKQARFVKAFTTGPTAGNWSKSVLAAGYETSRPGPIGCALGKLPHVVAAIDAALREEIGATLTVQAIKVIRQIITDETAPLKLRGDMAAKVVEFSGVVSRIHAEKAAQTGLDAAGNAAPKRLGELTRAELEAVVRNGAAILQAAADMPAPGKVIEGQLSPNFAITPGANAGKPSNRKAVTA
jgi:phage terminase small subunit